MFRRVIFSMSLLLTSISLFAQYPKLSDNSKVILFTCGPGDELYAGFGHSALWVSDPSLKIDRLYNYGTFDFDTPNFYGKFIRGKLDYMVSVTRAKRFIDDYNSRKILVDGQLLDLNKDEKQRIFEFLENNLLPENCLYKYDFFYDNCATRIRDVLVKIADGKVDFNTPDKNLTFRKMLFPYLTHTPWTKFGINLILGLTSDKKATPWDYQYLPKYMQEEFQNATIEKDGVKRKLVTQSQQYLPNRLNFTNHKADDPVVVFSILLLLAVSLTIVEIRQKKTVTWINYTLFIISSLAGLFLLFMWLGTDHIATAKNMNVLWLAPAQLLFLVSLKIKGKSQQLLNISALIYQFLISLLLLIWPQEAEISFTIISLIFAVRIFGYMVVNRHLESFKSH
jgi:hypothetical protein